MIVLQTTIDFLVNNKKIKEVNTLMGDNPPWEPKETKVGLRT